MRKIILSTLGLIVLVSVSTNLIQYYRSNNLSHLNQIKTEVGKISQDGFNDVLGLYIQNIRDNTIENAKQSGKLEGMISVVHKIPPQESEISSIWHAGYQRGLEQTDFVGEMQFEKGYREGVIKGREEYLKSINNILSSKEDFKKSLEDFAKKNEMKEENTIEKKPANPIE